MCLDVPPWLRSSVTLGKSLTSLDLFPSVYSGRMDWMCLILLILRCKFCALLSLFFTF